MDFFVKMETYFRAKQESKMTKFSELFGLLGLAIVVGFILRVFYAIGKKCRKQKVPKWEIHENDLILNPVKMEIKFRGGRASRRQAVWNKSLQQITKIVKTRTDEEVWRQGRETLESLTCVHF